MKLRVHGIRIEASHAAYEWEQKMGTLLEVDVEAIYPRRPAADKLSQVVPVEEIVNTVHKISAAKIYKILEALAGDVLDALWKKHKGKVDELVVRVKKIKPKSDRRIAGYEVEVRKS